VPRWLEVTADYRCNNRCLGCYSVRDDGPSMQGAEIVESLRTARGEGATSLWLGGGEPTLRKDLFPIVRAARALGFERVKLQTNGMLLAYPDFARRSVEAGITEVNFAIKGACAETHDRFTRTPGCFDLLLRAIDEVSKLGLKTEGDVLVYKSTVAEIPDIVRFFGERGVGHFNFWLLSAAGSADPGAGSEVPRLQEVVPFLVEAMNTGVKPITSLHTPPCVVPETHHACLFHAAALEMVVVNPGGHRFRLESSPIEGGVFLERCGSCRARGRCNGLRAEYLERYGDAEFQPLAE
jgi:MoaA/NifB/PqqE/SkfB family radical SAM enzyme